MRAKVRSRLALKARPMNDSTATPSSDMGRPTPGNSTLCSQQGELLAMHMGPSRRHFPRKTLWFRIVGGCDRFFFLALDYFTAGRRLPMPKTENRVLFFGNFLVESFPKIFVFNFWHPPVVVEKMSSEKWPHLCAKPKRFTGILPISRYSARGGRYGRYIYTPCD